MAARAKETQTTGLPRKVFAAGPRSVARSRRAYIKAGKEQEWNAGLRSYLEDAFNSASKEYTSGSVSSGTKFRTAIYGTPRQKQSLRMAMSKDQWQGFQGLMDVLEAAGRVPLGGSRTAFAKEQIEEMKRGSARYIGEAARRPLTFLQNSYQEMKFGNHAEGLAKIITSPDAMKQLKQLRTLSPTSQKRIAATAQILTRFGIGGAADRDWETNFISW